MVCLVVHVHTLMLILGMELFPGFTTLFFKVYKKSKYSLERRNSK